MKIFTIATIILFSILLLVILSSTVSADGTKAEDYRCPLCRDFVRRVVNENESPRKACRASESTFFDSCHFMLKETKLISKLFDLRAEQFVKKLTKIPEEQLRDVCAEYTSMDKHEGPYCPLFQDTFGSKRLKKLHADAAGWDVRVAPASSWMAPNTVRITVIDNNFNGTTANHSQKFLNQFSYNANFTLFATNKVVHTGIFPLNNVGGVSTVVLGENEMELPIRSPKPGQGIRSIIFGDPCWSSEFVSCKWGASWNILSRLTQLFNTLAKQEDALHLYGIVGDNFYDPLMEITPQFFNNLNAEATSTNFLSLPGNHDLTQHGLCSDVPQGISPKGATFAQYYGQNTYASSHINNANHSPFNFTGFNASDAWTSAPLENFFSTTLVGNMGFISFNGANFLNESMPYFVEACQWVKRTKMDWLFILGHWSGVNCGCAPGMATNQVRDLLVTLDGCDHMNPSHVKWIEGHSHMNIVVRPDIGFRFGGAGMDDKPATFGIPFMDSNYGRLKIWNFHIAYGNETGDTNWNAMMDCVNQNGGLHQCTHLAELFLDQPVYP